RFPAENMHTMKYAIKRPIYGQKTSIMCSETDKLMLGNNIMRDIVNDFSILQVARGSLGREIVFGPSFQIFWRRIGNIAQDNRLFAFIAGLFLKLDITKAFDSLMILFVCAIPLSCDDQTVSCGRVEKIHKVIFDGDYPYGQMKKQLIIYPRYRLEHVEYNINRKNEDFFLFKNRWLNIEDDWGINFSGTQQWD
ncbi:hypothetical protein ACJX0J_016654, partial [Zea mays]